MNVYCIMYAELVDVSVTVLELHTLCGILFCEYTFILFPHLLCRHKFVNNELIVKTGLVDKRKVLFPPLPLTQYLCVCVC